MELVFDRNAAKTLRKMQPKAAVALMARLEAIAADPAKDHSNVKAMQGIANAYRLRQGDWRAVYELDRRTGVMRVVKIGQRGQVYK